MSLLILLPLFSFLLLLSLLFGYYIIIIIIIIIISIIIVINIYFLLLSQSEEFALFTITKAPTIDSEAFTFLNRATFLLKSWRFHDY